jgi:hypothetical protein
MSIFINHRLFIRQDINSSFKTGYESTLFEGDLRRFCDILGPVAKSIKCLESTQATCSDVYLFFLAVPAAYTEILDSGVHGLNRNDQEAIQRAINHWFLQQIDHNTHDIFFTLFMLDPCALHLLFILTYIRILIIHRLPCGGYLEGSQSSASRHDSSIYNSTTGRQAALHLSPGPHVPPQDAQN